MSEFSAFEGEMAFRDLSPGDERSLATFALAVQAAMPAIPDPALTRNVVPELAAAAATGERAAARSAPAPVRVVPVPRRRPRFAMAARIVFAVALLPALFAGMAVAGVSLPGPAQDAFEAVGVELPNQDDSSSTAGDDGSGRDLDVIEDGATGAGQDKSNPARIRGRGNGEQGRGRALGKRGIPPGHDKANGNNAGGNGKGKAIGKTDGTPPGQAKVKPPPPKPVVPPGQAKKGDEPQQNAGGGGNGPSNSNAGGNGGRGPVDRALRLLVQ